MSRNLEVCDSSLVNYSVLSYVVKEANFEGFVDMFSPPHLLGR